MLHQMIIVSLILTAVIVNGFISPLSMRARYNSNLNMIFGKKVESKQGGKIVIKVDGRSIESDQKSVNLRRILIDENIDVYPLKAKVLGTFITSIVILFHMHS